MCNAIISPHDRQSRTASEYAVPPFIHINRHIDDKRKINPLSARVRTWRGHFWTRAPDRPVPVWSNSMYLTAASIAAPRARLPGSLSRATSHVPKFINSKLRANWWPRARTPRMSVSDRNCARHTTRTTTYINTHHVSAYMVHALRRARHDSHDFCDVAPYIDHLRVPIQQVIRAHTRETASEAAIWIYVKAKKKKQKLYNHS